MSMRKMKKVKYSKRKWRALAWRSLPSWIKRATESLTILSSPEDWDKFWKQCAEQFNDDGVFQ